MNSANLVLWKHWTIELMVISAGELAWCRHGVVFFADPRSFDRVFVVHESAGD